MRTQSVVYPVLVLIALLAAGCAGSLLVEKRRYQPGWHIAKRGSKDASAGQRADNEARRALTADQNPPAVDPESTAAADVVESPPMFPVEELQAPIPIQTNESRLPEAASEPVSTGPEAIERAPDFPLRAQSLTQSSKEIPYLPMILGATLAMGAAAATQGKRMRRMSEWASRHKVFSRWLLAASHAGLGLGSLFAGYHVGSEGYTASGGWIEGSIAAFIASAFLYPKKSGTGLWKGGFVRRKLHDLTLAATGAVMMFSAAATVPDHTLGQGGHAAPMVSSMLSDEASAGTAEPAASSSEVHARKPAEESVLLRIFMSLLAMGIFLLLLYFISVLSCELSCSGNAGLAYVLFFGGLSLLILLLALTFRKIWKSRKQPEPAMP